MRRAVILTAISLACACATAPAPRPARAEASFALNAARFAELPGWTSADLGPALVAFKRSCAGRRLRPMDAPLASGGRYGGSTGDWAPACAAADAVPPGGERAFFEGSFTPYQVSGPGEARLTAYFEPTLDARRAPDAYYSEPILRRPSDMVTIDIAAFAEAYDDAALRGAPRRLTGQIMGDVVRPYPKRIDIAPRPEQVIAWAHPVDVYNLQVQGSGRLAFPDGGAERAAFAAQNGYRWNSALGALRDTGQLPSATWGNFKAWADAHGPDATHAALSADPSYVFFEQQGIDDPGAGPNGAAGVALTPMGSIAVDPAYHPYGALVYVDGTYDGAAFDRLLVAQDTGGAIRRGPKRGDVFFGSGAAAGQGAERMNGAARWWTLLPRGVPVS